MRYLISYRWPGNVRELRNALESMMVLADGEMLTENDLPDRIREGTDSSSGSRHLPSNLSMEELERLAIQKALDQCDGNRTHAAGRLGISVRTLQRKLRLYEQGQQPPLATPIPSVDSQVEQAT
jgi:DNA-binding NtrC family response regulator